MFVMAHATYLREKARSMRVERQLTIDELAERLALSRSTIYYWVRDLPISGSGPGGGWPEAACRKGNLAMQRKYRLKGRIWRSRHGVLTVRVCETLFRAGMQVWMDRIRAEWQ